MFIAHPAPVKSILPLALTEIAEPYLISGAGDLLHVWDLTTPAEPEQIREVDAHWHDITAIRLWRRTSRHVNGSLIVEPWIVTTSLDGTVRRWKLADLLTPTPSNGERKLCTDQAPPKTGFGLTEEEKRQLDELLDSD